MSSSADQRIDNFCSCGCGKFAKEGNRFIHGHHIRGQNNPNYGKDMSGSNNPMFGRKCPEHSERMMGENNPVKRQDVKNKISKSLRTLYLKNKNWNKSIFLSPSLETRQKISNTLKGNVQTKESNLKRSLTLKGRARPIEVREKIAKNSVGKKMSAFACAKMSNSKKILYQTYPEKILRGENSPGWKGGISCNPYCDAWADKEYKESIKERDNYTCQNPDCKNNSNILCVHHIDYDKKNCAPKNLITLCNSCNSRANFNRGYWQKLYFNVIERSFRCQVQQINAL